MATSQDKVKMPIQMLSRCGVSVFLAALISACSSGGSAMSERNNECKWNRSQCMHEGSYEPGERDYAEEQARRLNKDASARLRRSGG